jgi:MFS family permease
MFTGIAALFPIVALYVRHRGGSALDAGLFIAGPMVANTLVQVPAGRLTDRVGRRPVLLGARLGYAAICFALFADRGPLWALALLRAAQGAVSGAYVPALLAALTDLTPPDSRATRFSQVQRAELVGLLVGPAIGGAVATAGATPRSSASPASRSSPASSSPASPSPPSGSPSRCTTSSGPQCLAARGASLFVVGISITLSVLPMLALATPGWRLADRANWRVILGTALAVTGVCAATYPILRPTGAAGPWSPAASCSSAARRSAPPSSAPSTVREGIPFRAGGASWCSWPAPARSRSRRARRRRRQLLEDEAAEATRKPELCR